MDITALFNIGEFGPDGEYIPGSYDLPASLTIKHSFGSMPMSYPKAAYPGSSYAKPVFPSSEKSVTPLSSLGVPASSGNIVEI